MFKTKYLALKPNHPTMVKLSKLANLARELGITIYWNNRTMCVADTSRSEELPPLLIEYRDPQEFVGEFPPTFDYRVIFDNPEVLKRQELREQEFRQQKLEEDRLKQDKLKKTI